MEIIIMAICIILAAVSIAVGTIGITERDESALVAAWVLAVLCFLGSALINDIKSNGIQKALIQDKKIEYKADADGKPQLYLLDSTLTKTFKEVTDD